MNEIQKIHAKNKREIEESNMADDLQAITIEQKLKHKSTINLKHDNGIEEFSQMARRPSLIA